MQRSHTKNHVFDRVSAEISVLLLTTADSGALGVQSSTSMIQGRGAKM